MANRDYFYPGPGAYTNEPPHTSVTQPFLGQGQQSTYSYPSPSPAPDYPGGPFDHRPQYRQESPMSYNKNNTNYPQDPFGDEAAIPMENTQYTHHNQPNPSSLQLPLQDIPQYQDGAGKTKRTRAREPLWSLKRPWFIYLITTAQIIVFIVQIVRNAVLTGSPIEIHPSFNPMIGPSPYVLINMGARYVSCMRNEEGVQNSNTTLSWPCPGQTNNDPSCTLSQLCGFGGVPEPTPGGSLDATPAPNQWFRFIVPIFLHAGVIHIGFNMLLQVLLGGEMERIIGPWRLALVYFSSGIFGFVMGGDFAASGIASCGASGSIFGIIALSLLDLLYTWPVRPKPWRDLILIVLDIAISFVLGLLPGLDNFSHIGGFLMGLVLGLCLLKSPTWVRKRTGSISGPSRPQSGFQAFVSGGLSNNDPASDSSVHLMPGNGNAAPGTPQFSLQEPKSASSSTQPILTNPPPAAAPILVNPSTFFKNRKAIWWAWWLLRAGALVGVIIAFIALIQTFYTHHNTQCPSCKYLSCLPVSNWCDIGDLTFSTQNSTTPSRF